MAKKKRTARDTYIYHLKQGKKIKRTGVTNNPERREQEYKRAGKRFSHMYVHPYPMSRDTALKREKKYQN